MKGLQPRAAAVLAFLVAALALPSVLWAQDPDTIPPTDTLPRPDTVVVDLEGPAPYDSLPRLAGGAPSGFGPAVWIWEREDILSLRAITLLEVLQEVPGMLPLRSGDYGAPEAVTAFGMGGGRIRVFWDGLEMLPLDGSVVDLARIGLGGLDRIRLERGLTEVRIELETLQPHDGRPMSVVEAGIGDLDTNHLRGTFVHPNALGGALGLGIERVDTRGRAGQEDGARSGGWVQYTRHLGDRGGIRAAYRQHTSQTAIEGFPPEITRSDWTIHGRFRLTEELVGDAFVGGSAVEGPDDGFTSIDRMRSQYGVRLEWHRDRVWLRGAARLFGGQDRPSSSLDLQAGGSLPGVASVAGRWNREAWEGEGAGLLSVRTWTEPFLGFSAFASWEDGTRGVRLFQPREPLDPPDDPEPPDDEETSPLRYLLTERSGIRLGGSFAWGPIDLQGAVLRMEADSLVPFGLHFDREGVRLPGGGERTGLEGVARIGLPVLLDGLTAYGALQSWEEGARYLPERMYQAGLDFHDVFLETGNLELWWRVGVEGRDPMIVPLVDPEVPAPEPPASPDLLTVPFYQSWNAFLSVRVLTFRLFVRWDNVTVRPNNQDFPDRLLPHTRATYGIRWTFWN